MSYVFFLVVLRRMKFSCQRFGTLFLFHLHRRVGMRCDSGWEICGAGPGMEENSFSGGVVAGSKNRLWRPMTSKVAQVKCAVRGWEGESSGVVVKLLFLVFFVGLFSGVWSLVANVSERSVCSIFIGEWVRTLRTHSPMKMEQRERSETLAIKIHMPKNNQKENIRHN
jgi:hypothetical protein